VGDDPPTPLHNESMGVFRNIPVEDANNLFMIKCPEEVDQIGCTQLETMVKGQWLNIDAKVVVLNFEQCKYFSNAAYRIVMGYQKALNEKGISLHSVNLNSSLSEQIKSDGMTGPFSPVSNLEDALKKTR